MESRLRRLMGNFLLLVLIGWVGFYLAAALGLAIDGKLKNWIQPMGLATVGGALGGCFYHLNRKLTRS